MECLQHVVLFLVCALSQGQLPGAGGWSQWALYSLCNSDTCTETWVRYCNNPRPEPGGATCTGDSLKKEHCRDTSQCNFSTHTTLFPPTEIQDTEPVTWSRWGPCSVTCGAGTRTRNKCLNEECETEEQPCIKPPCFKDDRYGEWSRWSKCAQTDTQTDIQECEQTRTRTCKHDTICDTDTDTDIQSCDCQQDICGIDEMSCDNRCISISFRCDLVDDCEDKRDETDCDKCLSNQFRCKDGLKCIPLNSRCDAFPDCNDGSDEDDTCGLCTGAEFQCDNTRCIPVTQVCDKKPDCEDGTDELACEGKDTAGGPVSPSIRDTVSVRPLTKCEQMSLKWDVTCLADGEYAPEHCAQELCYCVNAEGTVIAGTERLLLATRHTSCLELRTEHRPTGAYKTAMPTLSDLYTVSSQPITTQTTLSTTSSLQSQTTQSLPPLFTFSSSGPGQLNYVQYGEWSPWTQCSVVCGGGFQSSSRTCPVAGGACGGPDVSQRWGECNQVECVPASIQLLVYSWENESVIVTCRAAGLPQPFVIFRDESGQKVTDQEGEIADDSELQDGGVVLNKIIDYVEVRYEATLTAHNTTITCIATGEGQDRQTLDILTTPPVVRDFTVSRDVIWPGEEVTLWCRGNGGHPRPTLQLLQEGGLVLQEGLYEISHSVRPEQTTQYSCSATSLDITSEAVSHTVTVADLCKGVECGEYSSCIVQEGGTLCQCDSCDTSNLFDTVSFVCGSDCNTYLNTCEMNRASCLKGGVYEISVMYRGSCEEITPPQITSTCQPHTAFTGGEVTLTCDVGYSEIQADVTWYKDGSEIGWDRLLTLSGLSSGDAGEYSCVAGNCAGSDSLLCPVHVEEPQTQEVVERQEQCVQYGAGHFHQFSGVNFDFPGVCHYVLAMDCRYGSFYIYTGTTQCGTTELPLAYTASVTLFVESDAVVLLRGFDVNEFGIMKHLHPGETLLYKNFKIWRDVELMHVTHSAVDFTLSWDGITTVVLRMPESYRGRLCGLCGDVGVAHPNSVENVHSHVTPYQVDRYGQCNVADVPENTCLSESQYQAAQTLCLQHLYSTVLTKCHSTVGVAEYTESCIYDVCGVAWYAQYNTGLCNVLSAYSHSCHLHGVDVRHWRRDTPCNFTTLQHVAYMSRRRRRK